MIILAIYTITLGLTRELCIDYALASSPCLEAKER